MRKVYNLEDLDCALCAQKMEDAIKKVEGVKDCRVNFLTQKMTIDFEEDVDVKTTMKKIVKVCKRIEPECTIEM